jgi:hypothetical protein
MAGTTPVKPGTVNFCNAAVAYCTDITLQGTAQLTANGTATIKFRPGVGSHSYKAVFAGNKTDAASSSGAAALTVTGPYISEIGAWVSADESEFPDYNYIIELGGSAGVAPSGPISLIDTSNGNAVVATPPIYTDTGAAFLPVENLPVDAPDAGVSGNQAESVVVQDFNGDGIPDLAVSENGPAIRVLLGNGDGTFTVKSTIAPTEPGTGVEFIAAGDFNGDGITDLVVSPGPGGGGGSPVVYLGNGDGTFTRGLALTGVAAYRWLGISTGTETWMSQWFPAPRYPFGWAAGTDSLSSLPLLPRIQPAQPTTTRVEPWRETSTAMGNSTLRSLSRVRQRGSLRSLRATAMGRSRLGRPRRWLDRPFPPTT